MIHEKVQSLQLRFVECLRDLGLETLHPGQLVVSVDEPNRGHFLTFQTEAAESIHQRLLEEDVITDYRGDRLRFGFGIYQDEEDLARLCHTLRRVLS
jgi:selenocysteine lyase/cysteine desulfurase